MEIEIIQLLAMTIIIIVIMIINNSNLFIRYQKDGKLKIEKCKKKKKKLKSPEYSNCYEPLSQEWINERYQAYQQWQTFLLIGIHSMQAEKPLQGMELQEKGAQKDCSIQEICLERTYS